MASRGDIRAGRSYVELFVKKNMFTRGLRDAGKTLQGFGTQVAKVGAVIAGVGAGIIAFAAQAVRHFASVGDELDKMSARTGVATGALAELGFAAEQSGSNLQAVENSIRKMQKTIGDAHRGLSTATEGLDKVGLSAQQLAGMAPEDQFQAIADGVAAIEDPTQRASAAMDIFGSRQGTALLPMLESMRELRQEARDLGIVPTEDAVSAAAAVTDAINRVRRVAGAMMFEIGDALAGATLDILERIKTVLVAVNDWIKNNKSVVVTIAKIGAVLVAVGSGIAAFGAAIIGAGAVLGGIVSTISAVAAALAAWKAIVIGAVAAFAALGPIIAVVTALGAAIVFVGHAFREALKSEHGEAIMRNLAEIRELVVEIGGNLIRLFGEAFSRASQFVGLIVGKLTGSMDNFRESAGSTFEQITAGIRNFLDLISLLTSDWDAGWAAMQTISRLAMIQLRDGFFAAISAIRLGFARLAENAGPIFGIIGEMIASRMRATAETIQIIMRTAFEAAPIAAKIAFIQIEQAALGMLKGLLKINELILTAMQSMARAILQTFTNAFAGIGQALLSALRGDLAGIQSALQSAMGDISGVKVATPKEGIEFLSQGTAERKASLEGLKGDLATTVARGASDIAAVQMESAGEIGEASTRLAGIGVDVGREMADEFNANFRSAEQDAIKLELEGQLGELAEIRQARRDQAADAAAQEKRIEDAKDRLQQAENELAAVKPDSIAIDTESLAAAREAAAQLEGANLKFDVSELQTALEQLEATGGMAVDVDQLVQLRDELAQAQAVGVEITGAEELQAAIDAALGATVEIDAAGVERLRDELAQLEGQPLDIEVAAELDTLRDELASLQGTALVEVDNEQLAEIDRDFRSIAAQVEIEGLEPLQRLLAESRAGVAVAIDRDAIRQVQAELANVDVKGVDLDAVQKRLDELAGSTSTITLDVQRLDELRNRLASIQDVTASVNVEGLNEFRTLLSGDVAVDVTGLDTLAEKLNEIRTSGVDIDTEPVQQQLAALQAQADVRVDDESIQKLFRDIEAFESAGIDVGADLGIDLDAMREQLARIRDGGIVDAASVQQLSEALAALEGAGQDLHGIGQQVELLRTPVAIDVAALDKLADDLAAIDGASIGIDTAGVLAQLDEIAAEQRRVDIVARLSQGDLSVLNELPEEKRVNVIAELVSRDLPALDEVPDEKHIAIRAALSNDDVRNAVSSLSELPDEKRIDVLTRLVAGDLSALDEVPDEVQTTLRGVVDAPSFQQFAEQLRELPEETRTTVIATFADDGIVAAFAALDSLPRETRVSLRAALASEDFQAALSLLDSVPEEKRVDILAGDFSALGDLPEEERVEIRAALASEDVRVALSALAELPEETRVSIVTHIAGGGVAGLLDSLDALPDERRVAIRAALEAGDIASASAMLAELPEEQLVQVRTAIDSDKAAELASQLAALQDSATVQTGIDVEGLDELQATLAAASGPVAVDAERIRNAQAALADADLAIDVGPLQEQLEALEAAGGVEVNPEAIATLQAQLDAIGEASIGVDAEALNRIQGIIDNQLSEGGGAVVDGTSASFDELQERVRAAREELAALGVEVELPEVKPGERPDVNAGRVVVKQEEPPNVKQDEQKQDEQPKVERPPADRLFSGTSSSAVVASAPGVIAAQDAARRAEEQRKKQLEKLDEVAREMRELKAAAVIA